MCINNCGAGTSKHGTFGFERGRLKLEGGGYSYYFPAAGVQLGAITSTKCPIAYVETQASHLVPSASIVSRCSSRNIPGGFFWPEKNFQLKFSGKLWQAVISFRKEKKNVVCKTFMSNIMQGGHIFFRPLPRTFRLLNTQRRRPGVDLRVHICSSVTL